MQLKLAKNVIIEELDTKFVILNIDTGKYLETNSVGGFILNNLEKFATYDDLLNHFMEKNKLDYSQAESDLKGFIDQAKDFGLFAD